MAAHSWSVPVAPFAAISSSVFAHSLRVLSWPSTLSGPWHSLQTLNNASRPGPGGKGDDSACCGAADSCRVGPAAIVADRNATHDAAATKNFPEDMPQF